MKLRKQINVFEAFNFLFFNACIVKGKFFEIIYIGITFSFCLDCDYYTLQTMIILMIILIILQMKTTKNAIKNGQIFLTISTEC